MMELKVIKTEEAYEGALARIDEIMDAEPGTPEMDELEVLSLLVEAYEDEHYAMDMPDPIAAITFRMEQQGLTRKDMQAYLGSQARVSEVLNGKRPLSKEMMRRLHAGLGIPAEVLLQEPGRADVGPRLHDPADYPFTEMFKRGYLPFEGTLAQAKAVGESLLDGFFAVFQGQVRQPAYCRRTVKPVDVGALEAWQARALHIASQRRIGAYVPGSVTEEWTRELVGLSSRPLGPLLVGEHLAERGIHFVLLEHLPKTYLDGACFVAPDGHPVVGMTLRYDRVDNFWFTLAHELAHLVLHLDDGASTGRVFFDELENARQVAAGPEEREANDYAANMLIPDDVWQERSERLRSPVAVLQLADELGVSPAIVAGRVRWQRGNYRIHDTLVGKGQIRALFRDDPAQAAAS